MMSRFIIIILILISLYGCSSTPTSKNHYVKSSVTFKEFLNHSDPAGEIYGEILKEIYDEGFDVNPHLERLSPEARLVYVVMAFDGEIHNGGFDQFFHNSAGNYFEEIRVYLEKLGAKNSLRMLNSAMDIFPNSQVPKDRYERQNILVPIGEKEEVQNKLNKLNEEFWKYEDNLTERLNNYIRKYPEARIISQTRSQ